MHKEQILVGFVGIVDHTQIDNHQNVGIIGIVDHTQIDSHQDIGVSHRVREVPTELGGQDKGVLISLKTSVKEVFVLCDVTQMMELDFSE